VRYPEKHLGLLMAAWALVVPAAAPGAAGTTDGAGHVAVRRNPAWPNLEEVIVVMKCHLDVGYTMPVPKLIEKSRTRDMDRALALFAADANNPADSQFRWTLPSWSLEVALDADQTRQRRERIDRAILARRLQWHALPYTFEAEAADLEEMVRMMNRPSRLSRQYALALPRWAKLTDVPDHSWVLPTLLARAGVVFLHMGLNPCSKPMSEVGKMPQLCWWEGPDGSRVLLGTSPTYGWSSVTPPKGWKYRKWLVLAVGGDNAGLPGRHEAARLLAKARKELPGVTVRFGDPAEFADAVIAEEKRSPTLPVVRGDMPGTWGHGQMSQPDATGRHRRAVASLITLGQLDTTLRAFGVETEPVAETLRRGYDDAGLFAEHTWGLRGHGVRGEKLYRPDWRARYDAGAYREFDASFDYHRAYARRAAKTADDAIAARMAALARRVAVDGPRVTVFNPLPWARDADARVKLPAGWTVPGGVREGETVVFRAEGLPAGGYRTYRAVPAAGGGAPAPQSLPDGVLATRHFAVTFDLEKGGISSLVETATGRELVRKGRYVLGQFLHERFSRNEVERYAKSYNAREPNDAFRKPGMPDAVRAPFAAITPGAWRARVTRTALTVEVTLTPDDTKGLANAYELRFSFPEARACVDIAWRVDGKTPDPLPEGGWICLPFNVDAPVFRVGRAGASIDPARDIIFGAIRDLFCTERAITVRRGAAGAGVAVASADRPQWSLGRPGLWRYEPDYVPTEPTVFANLYNNKWSTNYPLWVSGSWTASLRVFPVAAGADEEAAVFTPAWEMRQCAAAAFADGPGGSLPASAGGLAVSRKGVRVTAFCPNPDAAGTTVLRVWEQAGISGEVTVTLPAGRRDLFARPVTLRGEPAGDPLPIVDGRVKFPLAAWAPRSFVLSGPRRAAADGQSRRTK
jgi:hypothetical protein